MISDANRWAEIKRQDLIKTVFLADKYLSELKTYIGTDNYEYNKDTISHLETTASKLARVVSFIETHQSQLRRISESQPAPRLVAIKSYA
jgi:hypothetical protein